MERLRITDGQRTVDLMDLDSTTLAQLKRNSWIGSISSNLKDPVELRLRIQLKDGTLDQLYGELRKLHELLWFASEFGRYRLGRPVYLEVLTENETTPYYCHILRRLDNSEPSSVWSTKENRFIEAFELRLLISPLWIYREAINYAGIAELSTTAPGPRSFTLGSDTEIIPSPTILTSTINQNGTNTKPLFFVVANLGQLLIGDVSSATSGSSVSNSSARNGSIWQMSLTTLGQSETAQTATSVWTDFDADHARIFVSMTTGRFVSLQAQSVRSLPGGFTVTDVGPKIVVVDNRGFPLIYDLGVVSSRRTTLTDTIRFNIIIETLESGTTTVQLDWIAAVGEGPSPSSTTASNNVAQLPSSYIYSFPNGIQLGLQLLIDPGIMRRQDAGALDDSLDRAYAGVYYTTKKTTGSSRWENAVLLQVTDPLLTYSNQIVVAWLQTGIAGSWLPFAVGTVAEFAVSAARRPASLSPFREAR